MHQHKNEFSFCVTAVYDAAQALVACEAGANYVAVYVNRATKQMGAGFGIVGDLSEILVGSQTQIGAASLKSPNEVVDASRAGAQHITVPFDILTAFLLIRFPSKLLNNSNLKVLVFEQGATFEHCLQCGHECRGNQPVLPGGGKLAADAGGDVAA